MTPSQIPCSPRLKTSTSSRVTPVRISVTVIRKLVTVVLVLVFNLGLHGIWLGVLSDQLSRFTLMRRRFKQGNWVNLRI